MLTPSFVLILRFNIHGVSVCMHALVGVCEDTKRGVGVGLELMQPRCEAQKGG